MKVKSGMILPFLLVLLAILRLSIGYAPCWERTLRPGTFRWRIGLVTGSSVLGVLLRTWLNAGSQNLVHSPGCHSRLESQLCRREDDIGMPFIQEKRLDGNTAGRRIIDLLHILVLTHRGGEIQNEG